MDYDRLKLTLTRHEGSRDKPYFDSVGKTTIAIGRNLDDVGLFPDEIDLMFRNDVRRCERELRNQFKFFDDLNSPRAEVLLNMAFNLGLPRLKGFKRMFVALSQENYREAAVEMLDSKWARQVGNRAKELSNVMERGSW